MLRLAIQPPAKIRPGVALYPPVAALLSTHTSIYAELGEIWAVVTLIHKDSGETLHEQLGGRVADSAHPLSDGSSNSSSLKDRAYFLFPDLTIHQSGRYRIRVTLMHMDYSCTSSPDGVVRVREIVDSHSILVEEGASRAKPTTHERAFIRVLREDGQQVPSH